MSSTETITARAVRRLLDGHPPNGIDPASCGHHEGAVRALYHAHEEGGTGAVKRVFDTLAGMDAALAELVAGAAPNGEAEPFGEPDLSSLEDAAPLPGEIFKLLPDLLQKPCRMFERSHRRDVFLTGALGIVSGCLPNLAGYYGSDVPERLGPNLYAAVVAGAAGGKNALGWSRRLGEAIDQAIRRESDHARQLWKERREYAQQEGEAFDDPEPPARSLFLPADSSASFLFRALKGCGERAVLFSSEIDTLTNAIGQEWGKFDDLLRQAYHHEGKGYGRKSEGEALWLEHPFLAVVLSGTPGQYASLMQGSTENGLYSRVLLYYFDAAEDFHSQRPTEEGIRRMEEFERLSERVRELYALLEQRAEPLRFALEDRHWQEHVETFRPLLRRARLEGAGHLEAVVKRAGVWAFRISMTLAALRAFEEKVSLSHTDELMASEDEVRASLLLAKTYADHALRFGLSRLGAVKPSARQTRIRKLLTKLSEEFTSGDAYRMADTIGLDVSNRTIQDDLKHAEKQGLLCRLSDNGRWRQTDPQQA